ncbi:MAG TPA: hypothetical protein VLA11_10055 [Woeseiaceae bacterium]|nr:hypothetical protein [Woeseiaceae bacterium]
MALLQTLLDIIRLRKGPDALPYSWLLCLLTLTLWLFSGLSMMLLSEGLDDQDFLVGTFTGVVALACYASVIVATNHAPRLLQTATAILGCGALLTFIVVTCNVFLAPFLSADLVRIIVTLILLWSIPVEGHILSKAIDRPRLVGIIVAMAVFIFQLYLYSALNPVTAVVAGTMS